LRETRPRYLSGLAVKVLQVIAPAPFGGAESVVRHLSEALQGGGHEVHVIALGVDDATHPWLADMKRSGIEVMPFALTTRRQEPVRLREYSSRFGADIVHSHGYRADVAGLRACWGRTPWVATVHGFTPINLRVRAYQWLDCLALRFAAGVVAVSARLVHDLASAGLRRDRIHLIRNASRHVVALERVAARRALDLPLDEAVIAWIGRFSKEKGPDRLPHLLRSVSPSCTVALIGDGPLRATVVQQLQDSLGSARVRYGGTRRDAASLMSAFDLLLLPSRTEGMPMVVLEAMEAGVPVLAFDVGDVRHAVTDATGWLVPDGDQAAFTTALEFALLNVDTRAERGAEAKRLVGDKFSTEAWLEQHLRCYDEASGRRLRKTANGLSSPVDRQDHAVGCATASPDLARDTPTSSHPE